MTIAVQPVQFHPPPLSDLLAGLKIKLDQFGQQMDWAEDEIAAAIRRHPAETDTLFHVFTLLRPTSSLMATEAVYRSHCREVLDRVAAGEDTRPGTATEVCCACCDSSQVALLTSPAAGLYMRMWAAAFGKPVWLDRHQHHEALEGSQIDDLEVGLRRKLAVKSRTLGPIECSGRHHGEPVQCRYAQLSGGAF